MIDHRSSRSRSFLVKLLPLLSIPLLLLPGCADGDGDSNGRGKATLTLGEERHELQIRVCDFSGDADTDQKQTLVARDKDRTMQVFVSRTEVAGMLSHSVGVHLGNVFDGGRVFETTRLRRGERWINPGGGPNEQLIRIDGDKLSAEGVFTPQRGPDQKDPEEEPMTGSLQATCSG